MVFVFLILKGVMGLAIQKASKVKKKMKEIRDVNDMDINQSKSNENPNYVSQTASNPNADDLVYIKPQKVKLRNQMAVYLLFRTRTGCFKLLLFVQRLTIFFGGEAWLEVVYMVGRWTFVGFMVWRIQIGWIYGLKRGRKGTYCELKN